MCEFTDVCGHVVCMRMHVFECAHVVVAVSVKVLFRLYTIVCMSVCMSGQPLLFFGETLQTCMGSRDRVGQWS